ncbi:MAG: hypothetical protein U0Z26_13400 [Anaerolineales bacterium]
MFFQLKKAGVDYRYFLFSLLWSIPFSIANAFSEEAIFRMDRLPAVWNFSRYPSHHPDFRHCVWRSPLFRNAGSVVGALMAGFLGWLLAMSLIETQGILIAWAIHFAQDVVIIASMILMSRKNNG